MGQKRFFEITNDSEKLRECFKSEDMFLNQASRFEKTLNGVFHQSFEKIRGKKRKQDKSEVEDYLKERKRLKIR